MLAGVFLGWSYLTREFTAILFPLVPLLLRACRIPWRGLLYVGAGALALFGLELLWGALVYGDPFTRPNILTSRGSGGFDPEGARQFRETDPWRTLGQLPILFHQRSGGMLHGVLFGCALLGPLFWIFKKEELRNRFLFVWAWCFTCYVFFTLIGLAPILFNRPLLRMHKFRYWLPILPAVYIGGAAVLLYGWSRLKGMPRILRNTMIPFLILAPIAAYASYQGIGSISGSGAFLKNGSSHYRELRSFLRTHGSHWRWMWTDQGSGKAMSLVAPMYMKGFWGNPLWDGEIRYLNSGSHFLDREALTEGPVLVHHEVIQWRATRRTVPDYLIVPDLRWKSVFLSSNRLLVLYSTGEIGEPELLFRVTPDDWQSVPSGGRSSGDARIEGTGEEALVRLASRDRLYVADHRGQELNAPSKDHGVRIQGGIIRGILRVSGERSRFSTRSLRIACFFYDPENGRRHRVWAGHPGVLSEDGRLAFICAPPDDRPYDLRIGLYLTGPLELGLGEAQVFIE